MFSPQKGRPLITSSRRSQGVQLLASQKCVLIVDRFAESREVLRTALVHSDVQVLDTARTDFGMAHRRLQSSGRDRTGSGSGRESGQSRRRL